MHHKFRLVSLVGAMLGFLLAATPITAHHAIQAQFDQDRLATITGVMRRVMWINPHVRWFLDVEDENGVLQTWSLEWTSANRLAGTEMTRTTLRPKDVVIATGDPARTPGAPRLLLRQLRRPSDGWEWIGDID